MKYLDEMAQKRILIVVPHPDDELNIAGIVINNHNNKNNIWILYTTNFDIYGESEVSKRHKELQKLSRYIGIPDSNIIFLGFHVYDGTRNQYAYSLPGTIAVLDGELETEEALKTGIKRVIDEIKPDIIYSIDCDNHVDHRRTSLAVDTIANEFVRDTKCYSEMPLFFKGFAYATSWSSYNDFYESNNSTRCFEYGENTIAPYDWENRIRIPYTNNKNYSRFLSKCWLKKAYLCYRSQNIYSHIGKCINSDQILWRLETDNAFLGCNVRLSSGSFDSIFDVIKRKDSVGKVEYYPGEWKNIDYLKPVELELHNVDKKVDSIRVIFDVKRAESKIKVELFDSTQCSFEISVAEAGLIKKELDVHIPTTKNIRIRFSGDIGVGYTVKRIYGQSVSDYEDVKITDENGQFLYKLYVKKQSIELKLYGIFKTRLNRDTYTMEVITSSGRRILHNQKGTWIYKYEKNDIRIDCLDSRGTVVDSVLIIKDKIIYRFFLKLERGFYSTLARIQGKIYSFSRHIMYKKLVKKI